MYKSSKLEIMKNFTHIKSLLFVLMLGLLSLNVNAQTNYTFGSTTISLNDATGCAVTSYTFTMKTANNNNAKINTGAAVTVTFPAGVNISTATMAFSTFKGTAIASGWSISGQTINFNAPTNVGKKKSFSIVIANVTNGNATNANASVSMTNNSGGTSSYSGNNFKVVTSACPTVPVNDNCNSAFALTPAAVGSSACTGTTGTTFGATASPQTSCGGVADDDVWYTFVANNANHQVTIDGGVNFNAVLEIMSGSCAGTLTSIACVNATANDGIETANFTNLVAGTTYHVRIYHSGAGAGNLTTNAFSVCVTSTAPGTSCAGFIASDLTAASLPYISGAQTTVGAGNEITTSSVSNICGNSLYYGGNDKLVKFTPASSGNVSINLTSGGSYVGMTLYEGCPVNGGTCIAFSQSAAGNQSIGCAAVTSGTTYYLVVDSWPAPTSNSFNVTISAPSAAALLGRTCASPVNMTLPYNAVGESTLCFGNDYTNASIGSPLSLYETGEDKVYEFTTTGPDCMSLSITNASNNRIGYQIYSGCPGTVGTTCISSGGGATSGNLNGSFTVPGAGTYYLIIDSWANPSSVNYDLSLVSMGAGAANDAICSAQALILGVAIGGDNNCTGSTGEPAKPACWSTGNMNTVWFSAVVPASGKLKVRTTAGTLLNTQIAAYSGTCAAPVYVSCNDNLASCGGTTSSNSELSFTGLIAGTILYFRVDGNGNTTGTFSILAVDGDSPLTAIPGQDCGDPNPVCNNIMSVSNPGYSGFGSICDLPNTYCLASGERNVVWYRVPISVAGDLNFSIVPNDFNSSNETGTDYDFAVWEIVDAGVPTSANCTTIASGAESPDACNYSYLGVTGLAASGNAPGSLPTTVCPSCPGAYNPSPTFNNAYEASIGADAGDVYLIAISNYTSSTSGFRILFPTGGTNCTINYAASLASAGNVTWSGGDLTVPTVWTDVDNWGGCTAPACNLDAYVAPFTNQPILVTGNTYTVKNLQIQAGASLTLQAGSTLEVCGDFTNFGSLNAHPNSTVVFKGSAASGQKVIGNVTGGNKFGNFTVTKAAGTGEVLLVNDVEIGGNLLTSNINSIINSNERYVKVGGDFTNFSGNTTYKNTGTVGTLEFNGTGSQSYNQGLTQLDLNKVITNNTAPAGLGVNLLSDMFIKATTGTLTLNQGTITTGGTLNTAASATITGGYKVHVLNTTAASVSTGNNTSYVDGTLRRHISTGAFNWPVGKASTVGYQRALTNFTSITGMTYVDSRFDAWPTTCSIGTTECGVLMDGASLDNGMWTMLPDGGTCVYDCTLYPLGASNETGTGFTIIKRPHTSAINNTGWIADGTCGSNSNTPSRFGMTNFSFLGVDQGGIGLPIELLNFDGEKAGLSNLLKWSTASERDNDYFTLERSQKGIEFEFLAEIDGAGNSNSTLNYKTYDKFPFQGITYYRLKQTDFNGAFTYSKIIALSNNLDNISMSDVYPNPTVNNFSFDFFSPIKGTLNIKLFDATGKLIFNRLKSINDGNTKVDFDFENYAKGIYNLEVEFEELNYSKIKKVIKN